MYSRQPWFDVRWFLTGLFFGSTVVTTWAQVNGEVKVVAHVYNGYARQAAPDGSYLPESYVFLDGGIVDEESLANDSMNGIGFDEVARQIAVPLKSQGYLASNDPETAQQLIIIWYGNTRNTVQKPTNYQDIEAKNARMLGFGAELEKTNSIYFTAVARDFYDEFRGGRYFVVLKAYDFQIARKERRLKLLWENRFSILRQASNFQTDLPQMAQFASRTFGREVEGIFDPNSIKGEVKLDELKILGKTSADK